MDKRIKCTACRRVKFEEDFKKNQKLLKTCVSCREKHKKVLAIEAAPQVLVLVAPVPEPVPISVTLEEQRPIQTKWYTISGHWIKEGEEYTLHKKLTQKLIRQFKKKSAFPIHQYLTKWLMVDIRDRYSPSSE